MIQKNISLKNHSNYRIGGNADYFAEVKTKENLQDVLTEWNKISGGSKNIFILGRGTNVLFGDEGFRGLVIKCNIDYVWLKNEYIEAGGGTLMSDLIVFFVQSEFTGLEWAGGLPGTVGGAIRGNAGAFGGETKDNLISVESLDLTTQKLIIRKGSECDFKYRSSIFKIQESPEMILSANFSFASGSWAEIKSKTLKNIRYRERKHPIYLPNIGSIFKNVSLDHIPEKYQKEFAASIKQDPFPVLPIAKLIIGSGLIGKVIGGAQVSTKHPNFIVNIDDAKARDVKELIALVKNKIKEKYDIELEEEIIVI